MSLSMRLSFLWRVIITLSVPATFIAAMYISASSHYSLMYDCIGLSNNTIRVDLVANAALDFLRYADAQG